MMKNENEYPLPLPSLTNFSHLSLEDNSRRKYVFSDLPILNTSFGGIMRLRDCVSTFSSALPAHSFSILSDLSSSSSTATILEKLHSIREEIVHKNPTDDSFNRYFHLFIEAWKVLSTKEFANSFAFSFPVFYQSEEVTKVLRKILHPVYHMRQYHIGRLLQPTGSGSCSLLTGCLGVGKTTILVCSYCLITILTEHIIPVYQEYSNSNLSKTEDDNNNRNNIHHNHNPLPLELISNHLFQYFPHLIINKESFKDQPILELLQINKLSVCLLIDEIQLLYDNSPRNVEIIQQIARIGKSTSHFVVASGSAMNTKDLCFYPSTLHHPHYPTLNNSVFEEIRLPPIRNKETFTNVIHILYPDKYKNESDIHHLFNYTGGIGRFMTRDFDDAAISDLMVPIDNLFHQNVIFQNIINQILLRCSNDLQTHTFNPWSSPIGLLMADVRSSIITLDSSLNPGYEIDKLIEKSLLFQNDNRLEVLRPGLLITIYNQLIKTNDLPINNRFEQYAFEGTLLGWSETEGVSFPSASHVNEEPIRRMLARMERVSYNKDSLFHLTSSPSDPSTYIGEIVQGLSNMTGIDGFIIKNRHGGLELEVTQIKTGRLDLHIGLGSISTRGSLKYILHHALITVQRLISKFSVVSSLTFTKLLLVTTKSLDKNCITFISDPNNLKFNDQIYTLEIMEIEEILVNINLGSLVLKNLKNKISTNV